MKIGYLTEPVGAYMEALNAATTKEELVAAITQFRLIAEDALRVALQMTDADFRDFIVALNEERQGRFCGDDAAERFGAIIMPATMLHVTMGSQQYKAPWGTVYLRMVEHGLITVRDGVATYRRGNVGGER